MKLRSALTPRQYAYGQAIQEIIAWIIAKRFLALPVIERKERQKKRVLSSRIVVERNEGVQNTCPRLLGELIYIYTVQTGN